MRMREEMSWAGRREGRNSCKSWFARQRRRLFGTVLNDGRAQFRRSECVSAETLVVLAVAAAVVVVVVILRSVGDSVSVSVSAHVHVVSSEASSRGESETVRSREETGRDWCKSGCVGFLAPVSVSG